MPRCRLSTGGYPSSPGPALGARASSTPLQMLAIARDGSPGLHASRTAELPYDSRKPTDPAIILFPVTIRLRASLLWQHIPRWASR